MNMESKEVSTPIKVAIGSKNPVKVNAALGGIRKALRRDDIDAEGFDVESNVSAQPMNDNETKMGALNRSEAAYAEFLEKYDSPPAYSIGMEGGVQLSGDDLECFAWMAIFDGFRHGTARTASFPLPKKVRDLVLGGMELGHADDAVFGRSNSKQKNGAVGLLTKDVIDREMYYEHAVILAMIPFQWENLYFEEQE